ncbi:MAG: NUDIX domain-containing protein [Proteobacteria bacterium]|nr:NUDIX domain-containing protein [Pseudomonadota bacterium]
MSDASTTTTSPSPASPRPVRQAATLIVLRDGAQGLETLLLRRAEKPNDQNSGASVFPGGLLDAHDRRLHAFCAGLDDASASARLGVAQGGLDYYAAAVRECFEESGLLFAQDAQHQLVNLSQLDAAQLAAMRAAAAAGTEALVSMCEERGWQLAMDRLAYFAHWLTPPGMPRRFDTRFFIAALPPGQSVQIDQVEIADHAWLRPLDAVDPARRLKLMNVQRRILQQLAQFATVDECLAHARGLQRIVLNMPRLATGPGGPRPINIDEPAYAEIGFVDPDGRGHARYALEAGLVLALSPRVLRVTAPSGEGPGAHSYYVGTPGGDAWALIDPQLADPAHAQALLAAAPGPVRWLLSTQRSIEAVVVQALRAQWPAAEHPALAHGQELVLGDVALRVLAPAGALESRGFLLVPDAMLFAGAARWSTSDLGAQVAWLAQSSGFVQPAH